MIRNWFSNFMAFHMPLIEEGILYYTVEHYYQAHKIKDQAQRFDFIGKAGPRASVAKALVKDYETRDDWFDINMNVMRRALEYKFDPKTTLGKFLINSYPESLVEFNTWHDNFWGHCLCPKCATTPKHNKLGIMLMEIRLKHILKKEGRCT